MTTKLLATSLVAAALLAACLLTTELMPAGTAAEPPVPRESTSLSERLKAGLQARLPQEFAYADRVAALVEQGELPSNSSTRPSLGHARREASIPSPTSDVCWRSRQA